MAATAAQQANSSASAVSASRASAASRPEMVSLTFVSPIKWHAKISLNKHKSFQQCADALCKKRKATSISLSFDGEPINLGNTPQQVGLEDNDQVDVQFSYPAAIASSQPLINTNTFNSSCITGSSSSSSSACVPPVESAHKSRSRSRSPTCRSRSRSRSRGRS